MSTASLEVELSRVVFTPSLPAKVVTLRGGLGRGSSAVLRRLASREGRRRVVLLHGERDVRALLDDAPVDSPCVFGIDDFHTLPIDLAMNLLDRVHDLRERDHLLVLALASIGLCPDIDQRLRDFPDLRFDLPLLTTPETVDMIEELAGHRIPEALAPSLSMVRGIPDLATRVGVAIRAAAVVDEVTPAQLRAACDDALIGHAASVGSRLARDAAEVAAFAALVWPEGSVRDAAVDLGITPARAHQLATVLIETGLHQEDPDAALTLRRRIIEWAPQDVLESITPAALAHLRRSYVPAERLYETYEALGTVDENYEVVAEQAFLALEPHQPARAVMVAEHAMRQLGPEAGEWAHRAILAGLLRTNWEAAARMLRGRVRVGDGPDAEAPHAVVTIPLEFCLEAPDAGRLDLPEPQPLAALLTCHPQSAQALRRVARGREDVASRSLLTLLKVMRGQRAEAVLAELEADIHASRAALDVDPWVAIALAGSHLGLADHDQARRWANIAGITAGPTHQGCVGLAHFIKAMADIRDGDLASAAEQAERCQLSFERLHAPSLIELGKATRLHVAVEGRTTPPVVPSPLPDTAHPFVRIYVGYVLARHAVHHGKLDQAIRGLFAAGRELAAARMLNPSLLNWRPHLSALFRATGQDALASGVEQDLLDSMIVWHSRNPQAAARRAHILGAAAGRIACAAQDSATSPEDGAAPGALHLTVGSLSKAEVRVVRLVVSGRSNRQTAAELFLSKRTVDTHLGNVYRKLGVASREELGRIFAHHPDALLTASTDALVKVLG